MTSILWNCMDLSGVLDRHKTGVNIQSRNMHDKCTSGHEAGRLKYIRRISDFLSKTQTLTTTFNSKLKIIFKLSFRIFLKLNYKSSRFITGLWSPKLFFLYFYIPSFHILIMIHTPILNLIIHMFKNSILFEIIMTVIYPEYKA